MAVNPISNYSVDGLGSLIQYTAQSDSAAIPIILFGIFIMLALGSFGFNIARARKSDFFGILAGSGFITTGLAFALNLIGDVVNLTTLVVCVVVTALFTFLLFLPKK